VNQEVAECSCTESIGNVKNTDCVISCDSLDREVAESSEVQQLRVELYRVYGRDYSRSNCITVDDSNSNCKIVNGVNVRANVESIRYIQYGVKLFVALYTQHVTIL
jgi:hypothetical protein